MAKTNKWTVGGYRLECAGGGLAPSCTECVPCDVAMQVKAAVDALRRIASAVGGTPSFDAEKAIEAELARIERACGGQR